jgi:hypothetical protein
MFKSIKTAEELEAERVANELAKQVAEAQVYLNSTDWYYARLTETGEVVPGEVVTKRKESRDLIRSAKGE